MNQKKEIENSVLIPVYNSKNTLKDIYQQTTNVLKNISGDYEIIFVDDGSEDGSWEIIKEIKKSDNNVKACRLTRNYGQHNALMCGFYYAKGKYIITIDDDLQHPPEEITKLKEKIAEGYDIVYGVYLEKKHSAWRNLCTKFIFFVYNKITGLKGEITSFRIIRREIVEEIVRIKNNFIFIDGHISWVTKNIGYTKVQHEERKDKGSGYTLRKLLTLALNIITNFSITPLELASFAGILLSGISLVMATGYFIQKVFFDAIQVSGFASIIIAITFFSGIQLFILGLLGEYIGRIQLTLNNKPQYCLREKLID